MKSPSSQNLFDALDATWPPAAFLDQPPWTLRRGAGGGQRVSAATALGRVSQVDIAAAEAGMRALDQHPLFMIRPGEDTLDTWLLERNYEIVDPVAIYIAPVIKFTASTTHARISRNWPPTPQARDLWKRGGIGPERVAVMERATGAKTALAAHTDDTCQGVAFVAMSGKIAMLHALEVAPDARRLGIGNALMRSAFHWAGEHGAEWLSLMVTRANAGANALYRGLGMNEVGQYHYRRAPQVKP